MCYVLNSFKSFMCLRALNKFVVVFKHDNDLSWWEITKGVKLESFCNKDFKFGFIKTENIVK